MYDDILFLFLFLEEYDDHVKSYNQTRPVIGPHTQSS